MYKKVAIRKRRANGRFAKAVPTLSRVMAKQPPLKVRSYPFAPANYTRGNRRDRGNYSVRDSEASVARAVDARFASFEKQAIQNLSRAERDIGRDIRGLSRDHVRLMDFKDRANEQQKELQQRLKAAPSSSAL